MSELRIPELSLVVLVGASGSGKSTFARARFAPYEVLSSDVFRGMVGNDENDQSATPAAFEALGFVAGKRLDAGLLTVVDATSVQPAARKRLVDLARAHDVLPVAIVLDVPVSVCLERNAARRDRSIPEGAVRRQAEQLRRHGRALRREGFRAVHVLRSVDDVDAAAIVRTPLMTDRRDDHGPFDVIGDVHGCLAELEALLAALGYGIHRDDAGRAVDADHPDGRRAVFLGDLVDRGPDVVGVLRLAMGMVAAGHALAVPGNHEEKLQRALAGRSVTVSHGLEQTLAQLAGETDAFRAEVAEFVHGLVSHLILDDGRLVVAHAGLIEAYQGRASRRVRAFALYGQTTGETDEFGLPVRVPWAREYRGAAMVLYGHTPTPAVEWVNNTACLDTGCVFGGRLTALRYPEREIVDVPAARVYYEPVKPFPAATPERTPGVLSLADVQGRRVVETADHGRITIKEEQAAGALEVMSRFAVDPRRLVYLPPTMSPPDATVRPGYLEHPDEAFAYYRAHGVTDVVCEEKHMGSRGVVLVSRVPGRFGAPRGWRGVIHTRTGRAFFDEDTEQRMLERVDAAAGHADLWNDLQADWLLLDCEILPWRLKAEGLIRDLYASVAASGVAATTAACAVLDRAAQAGLDVDALRERTAVRAADTRLFRDAYRRYVGRDGDVRIAPFQLLAAGSQTFEGRDHGWHLAVADRLVAADDALFAPTRRVRTDLADEASVAAAVDWWTGLTECGGEGMVVKPWANLVRSVGGAGKGAVQPGIKVRGREYLRIIYGPDYLVPENLARLRDRNTGHKRSLASREYALGLEAVRRAAAGEPLHRVHEAVFAVLALESDAVDPRL